MRRSSCRRWKISANRPFRLRHRSEIIGSSGPLTHVMSGISKPRFGAVTMASGRYRSASRRSSGLVPRPLESFTVGRTIVLSRGLIDVLPNEASLAMMLAHELSHVLLGHELIDTRFAYADRLMVTDTELLAQVGTRRSAEEESAADAAAIQMLDNSPYAEQLADAGLFLRILAIRASGLPNLLMPHVGDVITDGNLKLRLTELMLRSPELEQDKLDQISALPLGARLYVNPWTGGLELLQTGSTSPGSIREKAPLAVTPLTPVITYAKEHAAP